MAKLEIPSIVVDNNGSGGGMERQRSMKSRLSKQDEFEEVEEDATNKMAVEGYCADSGGNDGNANDQGPEKEDRPTKYSSHDDSANSNKDRNDNASLYRQRSNPKVKLLQRSHALCDDTSPPPETDSISSANTLSVTTASTLTTQSKTSSGKHHRLSSSRQSSSQGSLGSFEGSSPALSRDSSIEQYTDSTGTDIQQFIIDTLHKNQKDRMLLLKIEQELINLVKDNKREFYKFSQMSAYQRMIVHRVSAFFGLEHNVDLAGTAVVVNKTKNMRIPDIRFRDQIKDELIPNEPKKSILKRDSSSFEEGKEFKSPERQLSSESRRSKSFEEREEEYGKARARIFNQDSSSSQEGAVDSPLRSHESTHNSSRRSSQEDLRWPSEPRPWSSTDSDSSNRPTKLVITKTSASTESEPSSSDRLPAVQPNSKKLAKSESADRPSRDTLLPRRGGVPKASSFGGISVLARADSAASAKSASPRLTKAESFSSNSSSCVISAYSDPSGVNGESSEVALHIKPSCAPVHSTESSSTSTTTVIMASSATSPISLGTPLSQPVSQNSLSGFQVFANPNSASQQPVMWAVSNMESVPPGSILINPQTGQPYLNTDGSIYRHNPANPPPLQQFMTTAGMLQQSSLQPIQQQQQPPPPQLPQTPSQQLSHPITLPTQSIAAQSPFLFCAPALQSTTPGPLCDQQRHFVQDPSGNSSMMDLSAQLSSLSFSSTPLTAESLMGSDHSVLYNNSPASQMSQHALGMPVAVGPTAPTRPPNVLVQHQPTNMAQMPLYLISSSQPARYASPFSYAGSATTQNLPHSHQQSQLLEGHHHHHHHHHQQQQQQQQQHHHHHQQQQLREAASMSNQLQSSQPSTPTQQSLPPQGYQMQGAQCFQNYPMVSYGQIPSLESHNLPPCFSVASQSHLPISSSGLTYINPAFTYTVAPMNLQGGGSNGGVQPFNPSQSNFTAGSLPLCGLMPSAGGGGLISPAAPSVVHPSAYHPSQNAFRPQTPPSQVQGSPSIGMAAGQHQSGPSSITRAYSLTAGVIPSPCTGYSIYSPQIINSQQQQQPQQCPPVAPPSQTPPQFNNAYTHQVFANLPMYRPHMLVRPNTPPPPPPQGIIPSGNGQFATAPLLTKGYGIPGVDQRFVKTSDLYLLDTAVSLNDSKGMFTSSLANLPNGNVGIRPMTTPIYSRGSIHIPLVQGDMRLIGTPLQHQMQSQIRMPVILTQQRPLPRLQSPHQGLTSGLGRPPKVRRQRSRGGGSMGKMEGPTLSAQSSIDTDRGNYWNHILEVQGLPDGIRKSEAERYLEEVVHHGAKLQFVRNNRSTPESTPADFVITNKVHVYAVFESETAAQSALLNIKTTKFELRSAGTKQFSDLQAVS